MRKLRYACLLLLMFTFALFAFAQREQGSITGTVTDPSGAVLPNAQVTITSVNTGAVRNATTNANGFYTVAGLQPGTYDVSVQAPGFTTYKTRLNVTVGSVNTTDAKMAVTGAGTTVEVVAQGAAEVNTETQSLSQMVSQQQITQLPTLTRNPYDLVATSGNVQEDLASKFAGGTAVGSGAGYNINGQRAASTDILLDGGENVDLFSATVGQSVPLDSVQEFRVTTSSFTAEYGRASGGVVNVATRSGTNNLHGSLYEFNRLSALTANTFENQDQFDSTTGQHTPVPKGKYTRNQFGGSIGGPLIKDKVFFFGAAEFTRVRSKTPQLTLIPDPAFIAASGPATQAVINAFPLRPDLQTIGTVTVADVSKALTAGPRLSALPATLPVFDTVAVPVNTDAGGGSPGNTYNDVLRLDFNATDKTQVYARYAFYDERDFPGTVNFSPYVGFDTGQVQHNHNALFSVTHVFSPNVVSTSKIIYNRLTLLQPLAQAPVGPTFYFKNNTTTSLKGRNVALPGYSEFTPGNAIPFGGPQNVGQLIEDLSWTHGAHNFKFGGQFVYTQDNRAFGAYEEAVESFGQSSFSAGLDNFLAGQLQVFQAAINPQGKFPCVTDQATGTPIETPGCLVTLPVGQPKFSRSNRYRDGAAYIQDTWKVRPRLTLDLGLRWEYFGVQHNADPALDSNFYYGPGSSIQQRIASGQVLTVPNSPNGTLWEPKWRNFAPRIGFAFDVFGDGKTAVRGGYGIAYERNFGNVTFNIIQNPPNYAVVALQAGVDVPTILPTLSNSGPLAGSTGTIALPRTSLRAVDPNIPTAYAHMWSMSVEHQLAGNTVASIQYSGSRGVHQYTIESNNRAGFGALYLGIPATTDNPLPRLNAQYSNINSRGARGDSLYNGVTFGLRSSNLARSGLSLTANYTYSHAIDELSTTFSDEPQSFNLGLLDPFNPKLDRGNADYDIRHRLSISGIWDVPAFKRQEGVIGKVLGGWEVAPNFVIHSGQPYSIYDCTNAIEVCPRYIPGAPVSLTSNGGSAETDPIGHGNLFSYLAVPPGVSYADPVVGIGDLPTCGSNGCSFPANMSRRNTFAGPGFWNADFGIYKNFKITEKTQLQFRSELFNAFNHHNMYVLAFNNDVSSLPMCDTGVGGCSGSQTGFPIVQAKKGGYGNSLDERRFVQFALRLTW